eukprot:jgi/Chlat1/5383/Chrsp35S05217
MSSWQQQGWGSRQPPSDGGSGVAYLQPSTWSTMRPATPMQEDAESTERQQDVRLVTRTAAAQRISLEDLNYTDSSDDELDDRAQAISEDFHSNKYGLTAGPMPKGGYFCPICPQTRSSYIDGEDTSSYNAIWQHADGMSRSTKETYSSRVAHVGLALHIAKNILGCANDVTSVRKACGHGYLGSAAPKPTPTPKSFALPPPASTRSERTALPKVEGAGIVWPPTLIVQNLPRIEHEDGSYGTATGNQQLGAAFAKFQVAHRKLAYGRTGFLGFAFVDFEKTAFGYDEAKRAEEAFQSTKHGRQNFNERRRTPDLGTELYGYLARPSDMQELDPLKKFVKWEVGDFNLLVREGRIQLAEKARRTDEVELAGKRQQAQHVERERQWLDEREQMEQEMARNQREKRDLVERLAQQENKHEENLRKMHEEMQQQLHRRAQAAKMRQLQMQDMINALEGNVADLTTSWKQAKEREFHAHGDLDARRRLSEECARLHKELEQKQQRLNDEKQLQDTIGQAQQCNDKQYEELTRKYQEDLRRLNDKQETEFSVIQQKLAAAEQDKRTREKEVEDYKFQAELAQELLQPLMVQEQKFKDMVAEARRTGEGIKKAISMRWVAAALKDKKQQGVDFDTEAATLCSQLEAELVQNHKFNPWNVVERDGTATNEVNMEHPILKKLRAMWGDALARHVAARALELHNFNPSGRYELWIPWDAETNDESTPGHIINQLVGKITALMAKASAKKRKLNPAPTG